MRQQIKKIALLTSLIFPISFSFSQNLNQCNNLYYQSNLALENTSVDRDYMINESNFEELMRWPETNGTLVKIDNNLSEGITAFNQSVILAMDRWSDVGSGTLTYKGSTNIVLPTTLESSCYTSPRLVVAINNSNNLSSLAGKINGRCSYFLGGQEYFYSAEIIIFVKAGGVKIDWTLDLIRNVMLHEAGHAYNLEHPHTDTFVPSIYGVMAYYPFGQGTLSEYDARCARNKGLPRKYKTFARNINSSGIGTVQHRATRP